MNPYFYKIQEISTGKYYVGCQYGKTSDSKNLWDTYFTSCKYILVENKSNFNVIYVKPRLDAKSYEQKYLSRMYKFLGKDKFCSLFINRNLSPGILLQGTALENLKLSLKKSWESPKRKELHLQHCKRMKENGVYERRKGIDPFSEKTKLEISVRMRDNNPMKNKEIKNKHKESVNTKEEIERKRKVATGNSYTKGTKWYNNGIISKMFREKPTQEWKLGRLKNVITAKEI